MSAQPSSAGASSADSSAAAEHRSQQLQQAQPSSSSSASSQQQQRVVDDLVQQLDAAGLSSISVSLDAARSVLRLSGRIAIEPAAATLNLLLDKWQADAAAHAAAAKQPLCFTRIDRDGIDYYRALAPKPLKAAAAGAAAAGAAAAGAVPERQRLGHDDDGLIEYSETAESLAAKIDWLAKKVARARHFVAHTGAGISTAASIPDFRGVSGVWTRKDRNLPPPSSIRMSDAQPTFTHLALKQLMDKGFLKHIISQNVDGLHIKSGVPQDRISELHGNVFIEACPECKARFLRDYDVTTEHGPHYVKGAKDPYNGEGNSIPHLTGRMCDKCNKAPLRDTIIHFNECYDAESALDPASKQAAVSDFALCMGTSMWIQVPSGLAMEAALANGGAVASISLQATGKDVDILRSGGMLIHAKCDEVMKMLMAHPLLAERVDNAKFTACLPERLLVQKPSAVAADEEKKADHVHFASSIADAAAAAQPVLFAPTQPTDLAARPPVVNMNASGASSAAVAARNALLAKDKAFAGLGKLQSREQLHRVIEKQTNEQQTLQGGGTSQMVHFRACKDCSFELTGKVAKVIIEDCTGCKFWLRGQLLTSTIEVLRTKDSTLKLADVCNAHTLTLEFCSDLNISVAFARQLAKPVISNCTGLSLNVATAERVAIPEAKTMNQQAKSNDQFFMVLDGLGRCTLHPLLREGAICETAEEREEYLRKERLREQGMRRLVEQMISITPAPTKKNLDSIAE